MKAICGYWALDGTPAPEGTLGRMRVARVRCEAPHLEEWRDGPIAFGSAWWSPQPDLEPPTCIARHPETGCVVIADARLDNPAELRAALDFPAPPDAPDATTDHATSLILRAWLRWGEDCVDHIDGDFAFAVFDPRKQKLYIARDRMGERPFYVHHVPGKLLVFGSTSFSVLAHPRVPKDINEARIADYLLECAGGGLEGVDFTSTFYTAIERHPPRHVRNIDAQSERLRQYWTLEPGRAGPLPKTDDEWAEALTATMERAVAQRLAGPGRVGSMLSGGLDSTSLAIIAGEQIKAMGLGPLPTFSVINSIQNDCLETRAIRVAIQMAIFQPTLIDIADLGCLHDELEQFFKEAEEPFDSTMSIIDVQYACAAKLGITNIIDGGNGDSLFIPSGIIQQQIKHLELTKAWSNIKGLSSRNGYVFRNLTRLLFSSLTPNSIKKLARPLRHHFWRNSIIRKAGLPEELMIKTNIVDRLKKFQNLTQSDPTNSSRKAIHDLLHTFPVVGTERYYRTARRHGITPLTPFSDRTLIEFCINLPNQQRLRDGWNKPVLRKAMKGRMPDEILSRHDKQHIGGCLTLKFWEDKIKNGNPQELGLFQTKNSNTRHTNYEFYRLIQINNLHLWMNAQERPTTNNLDRIFEGGLNREVQFP